MTPNELKKIAGYHYSFQQNLSVQEIDEVLRTPNLDVLVASLTAGCIRLDIVCGTTDTEGRIFYGFYVKETPDAGLMTLYTLPSIPVRYKGRNLEREMAYIMDQLVRLNHLSYTRNGFPDVSDEEAKTV